MELRINTQKSVVSFKLEQDLLQKLDLYAINSGLTRSEVIRKALEFYLSNGGKI
jgi:metal-responsive CopG/Arc/MetJ family transcriptional regulator